MEIHPGIETIDLALYLKDSKTLVIADLHLGFEQALEKQGVLVPRFQFKDMIDRLEQVFAKVKPETVVLNGDLKHEFGGISKQEWQDTMRLFDYLSRKCKKIIVIKGNHDPNIAPMTTKKAIEVVPELAIGDIVLVHGDSPPKAKAKVILMGHEHPAVSLREKTRAEKFKCFLKGTYKKSVLIVLPSFNTCVEGTDVTKEQVLSPLITNIRECEVFVVDDVRKKTLYFGKVKDLPH
jgi:putative SbcD/Mre11-related phosphoesterase